MINALHKVRLFGMLAAAVTLSAESTIVRADQDTISLPSSEAGYTKFPKGQTTLYPGDSGWVSVGKQYVTCSRFESAAIPNSALINAAYIDLSCKNCRSDRLRVRICGDYTQPSAAPFAAAPFDLSDRVWTRECMDPTPGEGGSLAGESFDITPVIQEMVDAEDWSTDNDIVVCFLDNGSNAASVVSSGMTLTATFSDSGPVGGENPPGGTADCTLDTGGIGFASQNYADTDDDGYCNFPSGTEDFLGNLILDRPFEIVGNSVGGPGVTFRGSLINVVAGADVISDKLSAVVSTVGYDSGLVLNLKAKSRLSLSGGQIANIGRDPDAAGDLLLSTDYTNGDVGVNGTLILAEDLFIESNGDIDIGGQTTVYTYGKVKLEALSTTNQDIRIAGQAQIYSEDKVEFITNSDAGRVVIGAGVYVGGPILDFCGVLGGPDNVEIDPGAYLVGKIKMPTPDPDDPLNPCD